MKRFLTPLVLILFSLLLAPATTMAHPGHYHPEQEDVDEFATESFMAAVTHPFTGLDHLVTALALGWLAVSLGRQRGMLVGIIFLSTLFTGWLMGRSGNLLPLIEPGLALSVVLAGILLAANGNASSWIVALLIAFMGFWNGNAHGNELPGISTGAGLFAGTAAALLMGSGVAALFTLWTAKAFRYAGVAAIATGLVLCVARLS